ncbi:MAG: transglycosylase SLT domain-containing protein [Alphaproteobacteria bacterium]|jgi:soluble lytic murein transglycosylase|nr:transglycosylase SLT domain-containing protein [Alphaproteobacteria bacterium]MBU2209172.1 transglycosylase SLT domain-containing protein [Alphaproteobacteria bacterium]MBU2291965.1 transglycosylase SLT domain-containing protein [Alphaproteobacteria bacterium]MBU2397141.1 transglycosylase SLT domain-containing protein [Alphaproteobacteria bacterium]
MEFGHAMIAATLAAVLALLAPAPESLLPQERPYSAVASGPVSNQPRVLNDQDTALFRQGLAAARSRDIAGARNAAAQIGDPAARKLVEWALLDTSADQMPFSDLAVARTAFAGWPRADSRTAAAERALERGYAGPDAAINLFARGGPTTVQGAVALAEALEQRGRSDEARRLITEWWRTRSFDADAQSRILTRWGSALTQADHEARLNMLLLGPHGPATRAMTQMVSPERQAVAEAAMTLRTAYSPDAVVANLSPSQAMDPAVVLERVRILRSQNRQSEGFALLAALPPAPSHTEGQNTLWSERRNYFLDALERRNGQAAYDAMAGHGFPGGERMVDGEFFAGWAALVKLNDPARAARHFEALRQMSSTPITQGRALYWLGRAAEAQGNTPAAVQYYRDGARHIQTFYGQLAAEKAGMTTLTLPADPVPARSDVAAFEANEVVRALRILGETGETSLFRVFAYQLDDDLPGPEGLALLMDLSRNYNEGFTAMMVGRAASQRGFLMPERQYPIRIPPAVPGAAPLEFTQAITRQESSFDPRARSHANARGMMQFLPGTGRAVARQLGLPYSDERLYDADFNMTLGSFHLGDLTTRFGGSMLLTTIGYNAGPARPPQWIARCGDPRGGAVDPVDFIECAPFTETRNYMMRVMENMQVYRARLNGGSAPLTLSSDLRRGAAAGPTPYAAYAGEEAVRTPAGEPSE